MDDAATMSRTLDEDTCSALLAAWMGCQAAEPFARAVLVGDLELAVNEMARLQKGVSRDGIGTFVAWLNERTRGTAAEGPICTAAQVMKDVSWRYGDDCIVRSVRSGAPAMATLELLRRHGHEMTRAEAETLIASMVERCANKDVDVVETTIAEVACEIRAFRGPGQEGGNYLFRYRDVLWMGQAFAFEDGDEPAMVYPPTKEQLELSQVSQVWRVVRRAGVDALAGSAAAGVP